MHILSVTPAFDAIITGGVKRYQHSLVYDGEDCTREFLERLTHHGFREMRVADIDIAFEERVPGFYLTGELAVFGWVRWEKFQEGIQRKFWGSVVMNERGEWKHQVPAGSQRIVYCHLKGKRAVDISLPKGLD